MFWWIPAQPSIEIYFFIYHIDPLTLFLKYYIKIDPGQELIKVNFIVFVSKIFSIQRN